MKNRYLLIVVAGAFSLGCASENLKDPKALAEGTYATMLNMCQDFDTIGTSSKINSAKLDVVKTEKFPNKHNETINFNIENIEGEVNSKYANLKAYDETSESNDKYVAKDEIKNFNTKGSIDYKLERIDGQTDKNRSFYLPLNFSLEELDYYTIKNYVVKEENADTTYGVYGDWAKPGKFVDSLKDFKKNYKMEGFETKKEDVDASIDEMIKSIEGESKKTVFYSAFDLIQYNINNASAGIVATEKILKNDDVKSKIIEELETTFKDVFATYSDKIKPSKEGKDYKYSITFNADEISSYINENEILQLLGLKIKLTSGSIEASITTSSDSHLLNYSFKISDLKADEFSYYTFASDHGKYVILTNTIKINNISFDISQTFDRSVNADNLTKEVNEITSKNTWTQIELL